MGQSEDIRTWSEWTMQDVGGSLVGDMVFTMGVYRLELKLTNAESRTLPDDS